MGLSAPKNKFKLSADPNNNTWSKNTSRFGHKILTSQGWTPGSYLGNNASAHTEHHTQANLSHIKVLLKDDNLGLGAKRGSDKADNFGMAGFNDILSRLNGKSEVALAEEKAKRRDAELKVFQAGRWGRMVFVSGGFLVGDRIEKLKDRLEAEKLAERRVEEEVEAKAAESEKSSKKRKRREAAALETIEEGAEVEPKLKRKKRKSNLKIEAATSDTSDNEETAPKKSKSKSKSKKSKGIDASPSEAPTDRERREADKTLRKADKEARRTQRAIDKAERRARKEAKRAARSSSQSLAAENASSAPPTPDEPATSTPTTVPTYSSGRHMARRRFIMAKKMAISDPQAMREIFMVKSGA